MAALDASVETALDALELAARRRPSRGRRLLATAVPKLVAIGVVLAVWQAVAWLRLQPSYVIPPPGDVWSAFSDQFGQGHITEAIATSMRRAAEGFALSIAIGTPLGILLARVRLVRVAIGSVVAGLQSLPSVTWVPVGIVWFGLGETTILFVVVMGAVPSIAQGTMSAIDQVPPLLVRVGRVLGARQLTLLRHVVVPAALPGYIGGLKQAWSFSWRSLMAAELITFSPDLGLGLGQLLDSGRQLSDMTLVLMSVLVILAVGIAVDGLVFGPIERGVRRRRGLEAA